MIALSDVDNANALQLVRAKLHETGTEIQLSHDDTEMISWLGGRASDLASVRFYLVCITFGDQYSCILADTQNTRGTDTNRRS